MLFGPIESSVENPKSPTASLNYSPSIPFPLSSRSLQLWAQIRCETISASASLYSMAPKPITSPVPIQWYPVLSAVLLIVGLSVTAFFFIYEATTSSRNRSLSKELVTAAVASTFLGFGSLFLLLATGVYV